MAKCFRLGSSEEQYISNLLKALDLMHSVCVVMFCLPFGSLSLLLMCSLCIFFKLSFLLRKLEPLICN